MVAGETAMAIALADSLFLSISPDAARAKVILFLAVSMAPFVVVAPLIGPVIDRTKGGQRIVVLLVGVLRALVLVGMANSLDSLSLFPLAFAALVLGKTYAISKSALVPTTVAGEAELVGANSRLGQIAGITGFVVAAPAGLAQLIDTRAALGIGIVAFLGAAMNAYRLPRQRIAEGPPDTREREELRSVEIARAAAAMRVLRASVGFMFFHLAFWLRREIAGTAWFGLAVALSGLATLGANFVGPWLRTRLRVASMLASSLAAVALAGAAAAVYNRVLGGILLAAVVNAAAATGRLAFESTVQSGAPDANRGRAFARFETGNQLAWVLGGLVPVIVSPAGRVGFGMVALIGAGGVFLFVRAGGLGEVDQRAVTRYRGERATGQEHRPRSESEGSPPTPRGWAARRHRRVPPRRR